MAWATQSELVYWIMIAADHGSITCLVRSNADLTGLYLYHDSCPSGADRSPWSDFFSCRTIELTREDSPSHQTLLSCLAGTAECIAAFMLWYEDHLS